MVNARPQANNSFSPPRVVVLGSTAHVFGHPGIRCHMASLLLLLPHQLFLLLLKSKPCTRHVETVCVASTEARIPARRLHMRVGLNVKDMPYSSGCFRPGVIMFFLFSTMRAPLHHRESTLGRLKCFLPWGPRRGYWWGCRPGNDLTIVLRYLPVSHRIALIPPTSSIAAWLQENGTLPKLFTFAWSARV